MHEVTALRRLVQEELAAPRPLAAEDVARIVEEICATLGRDVEATRPAFGPRPVARPAA